jgi:hypothetical protein
MLMAFIPPAAVIGARARYRTCSAETAGLIKFYFFKPQRARELPIFSYASASPTAAGRIDRETKWLSANDGTSSAMEYQRRSAFGTTQHFNPLGRGSGAIGIRSSNEIQALAYRTH